MSAVLALTGHRPLLLTRVCPRLSRRSLKTNSLSGTIPTEIGMLSKMHNYL